MNGIDQDRYCGIELLWTSEVVRAYNVPSPREAMTITPATCHTITCWKKQIIILSHKNSAPESENVTMTKGLRLDRIWLPYPI